MIVTEVRWNLHEFCWPEDVQGMLDTVTQLLREVMEYTLCVGTYGAPFQTVKAAQSSQESAGNTQPFMGGIWAIRRTQQRIQLLRLSDSLPLVTLRRPKRHMNMDGSSTHRLRFNGNRSIHQANSFTHARET